MKKTDDTRLIPGLVFTTSKAGRNGLVSLLSPDTIPSASPARTSNAPK